MTHLSVCIILEHLPCLCIRFVGNIFFEMWLFPIIPPIIRIVSRSQILSIATDTCRFCLWIIHVVIILCIFGVCFNFSHRHHSIGNHQRVLVDTSAMLVRGPQIIPLLNVFKSLFHIIQGNRVFRIAKFCNSFVCIADALLVFNRIINIL